MVPIWLLVPAAASLALFVWLLTLHPAASGRVYAAYGGVYVATALIWLARLSAFDFIGAGVALVGMAIIVLGWRGDA
jgi:small multidrug resistance family-3 protein